MSFARPLRRWLAVAVCISGAAAAQPGSPPELPLSESVRLQLRAIYSEKSSRSAALRKVSSALAQEFRARRGDPEMVGVPRAATLLARIPGGSVEVDLTATVSDDLLDRIVAIGGEVVSAFPQYDAVRARIPIERIEDLAARADVRHAHEVLPPILNKINTSQGDVAHRANVARSVHGVNGAGVKIGVLSDSVDFLAQAQASGDLPGVTVLAGQSGAPGSGEGTAMLEIVHDLAPGAQLYFATGFGGEASMASNIVALKNAGCKVIVDDVSYFGAPIFQDGLIAQAVEQVAGQGVAYFSSAANSGNLSSGTAGAWEGNFVAGGAIDLGETSGQAHSFSGSVTNRLTQASGNPIVLQWSDAWGHSGNDYDLCAVNAAETAVLGCSADVQDGNDLPIEGLVDVPTGAKLIIINYGGSDPRFLHLATNRGRLQYRTAGETGGHSAAASAFSVAAVDVATAGGGAFVGGAQNPVEDFSSDGPRRVFYTANGTAITPGNFLASGGALRQKPDLAAADGVATVSPTPGLNPFFGTSAAAPHAAAIAALLLDAKPTATLAQIRQALTSTALDIMAPGVDRDSGYGIVDPVAAIEALTGGGGEPGPCVRDNRTACLLAGRFEVRVTFTSASDSGDAQVMSFNGARTESDQSVFFYFFDNANFEMGVKMVNACVPPFNKYWAYVSGLTNVGYVVTVRDSVTGITKTYSNPLGSYPQTVGDTSALECVTTGDPGDSPPEIDFLPVASLESADALRSGDEAAARGDAPAAGALPAAANLRRLAPAVGEPAATDDAISGPGPLDQAVEDNGLDITGDWEWSISSGMVHIAVEDVVNSRGVSTGPLRLALWASTNPVTGGGTTGHTLGQCNYPALPGGSTYTSMTCDTPYNPPPAGCYYVTILLLEQISGTWYYVDWVAGAEPWGLNGGTCAGTGACARSATRACLLGNRFEVSVTYQTQSSSGNGSVMSFLGQRTESDQSVFFYFFDLANFEMGVKMVNACVPPFNRFWAYVSGLTNQGYTVTIRDTVTGAVRTYPNTLGHYPQTVGDTNAFLCN